MRGFKSPPQLLKTNTSEFFPFTVSFEQQTSFSWRDPGKSSIFKEADLKQGLLSEVKGALQGKRLSMFFCFFFNRDEITSGLGI